MPTLPTAARPARSQRPRIYLRPPRASDTDAFLAAVAASRHLHRRWVKPPATAPSFAAYVARFAGRQARDPVRTACAGFLVCRADDDALVGVFNLSGIVRGTFQNAYLGYYALAPHAGGGYMGEGLALLLAVAYRRLKLHRVEVNIQPGNASSIALVRSAGFTREGFSRRYLKIGGRWRDHVRWALLAENWQARRGPTR